MIEVDDSIQEFNGTAQGHVQKNIDLIASNSVEIDEKTQDVKAMSNMFNRQPRRQPEQRQPEQKGVFNRQHRWHPQQQAVSYTHLTLPTKA